MKKTTLTLLAIMAVAAIATAQPPCDPINPGSITRENTTVTDPVNPVHPCNLNVGGIQTGNTTVTNPSVPPLVPCNLNIGSITAPELDMNEDGAGGTGGGTGGGPVGPGEYLCAEHEEFTIKVPVSRPSGMTVTYRWYRDGQPVTTERTLSGDTVTYTIPEDEAHADEGTHLHFMYTLSDGCNSWTRSDVYTVYFARPGVPDCILLPTTSGSIHLGNTTVTNPSVPPLVACQLGVGNIFVAAGNYVSVVNPTGQQPLRAGILGFLGNLFN